MPKFNVLVREQVLIELRRRAEGQDPVQLTPLMRFMRCAKWQRAAELVVKALDASLRRRNAARLSTPPGWLPPA